MKLVGEETFKLATQVIDEVVLVTNDELCAAIKVRSSILYFVVVNMYLSKDIGYLYRL